MGKMKTLKGTNLRILEGGSQIIAEETNCTITLTGNTEDVSTKDDMSLSTKQAIASKGWSVQVEALNVLDAAYLLTAVKNGTKFDLTWDERPAETSGTATQPSQEWSRTGSAYITYITFTLNDREFSVKSVQFTGDGELSYIDIN